MPHHYLMDNQTLFKDCGVFEFDYTPDTIHYRDIQLRQLAVAVRPALHGATPLNTILRGPPGTGKTTCVRQIFTEVEETTSHVVTVIVNCESVRTPFRVFAAIFKRLFGQQPLLSGIPVQRLTDPIAKELIRREAVLIVCLDDANYLARNGQLDAVLRQLLRMYETYPGVKTGVLSTLSTRIDRRLMLLDPAVVSVYQPQVIPFSPYGEEEMRDILHDRVQAGLYEGVVPSGMLDLIIALTMEAGDLRVAIDLLKWSVISAEQAARTVVQEDDVRTSFQTAHKAHFIHLVHGLKPDEQRLLSYIAGMKQEDAAGPVTSGALYASFKDTTNLSYTAFHTRLTRLADLRLIELTRLPVKGNMREVVLRFDPGMIPELCGTEEIKT